MSALSEMLTAANRDGLPYTEIERRARDAGFKLSHGTAHVYMTGRHGTVSRKYLEAFVAVFPSLKLDELVAAAQLPPDLGPYVAPEVAAALSRSERDAIDTIIKSMASGKAVRLDDATPTIAEEEPEIHPRGQSDPPAAGEPRGAAGQSARRRRAK